MARDQDTLADRIAPLDFDDVVTAVKTSMREGEFGARLAGADLDADTLGASIRAEVGKALSISFVDLLVKGWKGVHQVAALTGPDGPMDGAPRDVTLAGHTLSASHKPEIHVEIAGVADLRRIAVPVTLELAVSAVSLEITDRRITAVRAGQLTPKVTVGVESRTVLERDLPPIVLADLFAAREPAAGPAPGTGGQAGAAPGPD